MKLKEAFREKGEGKEGRNFVRSKNNQSEKEIPSDKGMERLPKS